MKHTARSTGYELILRQLTEYPRWLHQSRPLQEMLQGVASRACLLLGASLAAIYISEERYQVRPVTAFASAREGQSHPDWPERMVEFAQAELAVHEYQPVRLTQDQVINHPVWKEVQEAMGMPLRGLLILPMNWHDGRSMGLFLAADLPEHEVSPAHQIFFEQLAIMTCMAVENELLAKSEQVARQASETLRAANKALTQELNLEPVLETLLDYMSWVVPYDRASVILFEENQPARVRAFRSYDPQTGSAHNQLPELAELFPGWAIQKVLDTRQSLLVEDTREQPEWDDPFGPAGSSWMGIPLESDDVVLGLCSVEKEVPGFFSEDHLRLADALAAQAVVALNNARMFEALRSSEERYRNSTELASDFAYAYRVGSDHELIREWVTEAISRITGFSEADIESRGGILALTHPDDLALAQSQLSRVLAGERSEIDLRIVTKDGRVRWISNLTHPVLDPASGNVIRFYGIARDITANKTREREMEAVTRMAQAMRNAASQSDMAPVILEQGMRLVQAEGAVLALLDAYTQEISIELGMGEWSGWKGLRLTKGEGISGYVATSGLEFVSADASQEPRRSAKEALGALCAVVSLPLVAREKIIGTFWVGRRTAFTGEEVRMVKALTDMAANALLRAMLYEQTERRLQHLTALRAIDRMITSSADLSHTLDVLLESVLSQLRVDAADVLLFDPVSLMLSFKKGKGFRSSMIEEFQTRLGEGFAGQAALDRKVISLPDLGDDAKETLHPEFLDSEGFKAYFCAPLLAKGRPIGVLEVFHRDALQADQEWYELLETLAGQTAIAIESVQLFEHLELSNDQLSIAYDATIRGWSRALELRHQETQGHSQRVTELTLRLARAMGIGEAELVHIHRGALLHDVGKMGIPDSILLKNGPLTEEERRIMQKHPEYAREMLLPVNYLRPALDIPSYHHEKWDGSGYPHSLKGEEIPLAARIFAVVDVWDALTSDRPYSHAWSKEKARQELRAQAGKHFDPNVVEVFLGLVIG